MISLIEYACGFLTFAKEGCVYQLDITDAMCSLSLGREVECSDNFAVMNGSPDTKYSTSWYYPEPDELSQEEAATLAKEHFKLGRLLSTDEVQHLADENPAYLSFCVTNSK